MNRKLIRFFWRIKKTFETIILSYKLLGIYQFIHLCFSKKDETKIDVFDFHMIIRTDSIKNKLVNMCMITEVMVSKVYNNKLKSITEGIVIDIGSHIGSFAISTAEKLNGTLYSFEPSESSYDIQKNNIKLNKLKNINLIKKAVFTKDKPIKLYIDDLNSAKNSILVKNKSYEMVKCTTLPKIFSTYKISKCNFLKMDCEGAEYEILMNCDKKTFDKIEQIACECHEPDYFDIDKTKYGPKKLAEFLIKQGFCVNLKRSNPYESIIYAWKKCN